LKKIILALRAKTLRLQKELFEGIKTSGLESIRSPYRQSPKKIKSSSPDDKPGNLTILNG
jgi:hypothetical protein